MAETSGPALRAPLAAAPPEPVPEHGSTMLRRFGLVARLLWRYLFRNVRVRPDAVEHLRELSRQGTLVYVMRYRSTIDYLLVNMVLLREHLPLARFAPQVSTVVFRPLRDVLRWLVRRRPARPPHLTCRALVAQGEPVLLFMRSQAVSGRGRRAVADARLGPQYLRDVVRAAQAAPHPIFLVPVAIFRGKGFHRKESRLATLLYGLQESPGEVRRLFNYLWNAEETQLILGQEIALDQFVEAQWRDPEERLVRRLGRALQIFLYREERLVWGPALLPRRVVRRQVLKDPKLTELSRRLANQRGVPRRRVLKEARSYFDEMAASFHGAYFAVIEMVFNYLWQRVFKGLEIVGLEKVIECVKEHPVVLVPCHRSHFDYLFLSYIFHTNYLSPPHIAAGLNLSFWPLGPLFRGAGAFFIRRSFEDNELYKMVFRTYLKFLIREGYTQEFFIEGGRTRTGKILTPKLGMLAAIVNAFSDGVRRDLYLVPISIHYGRIPEEEAYRREVAGEEKEPESLGALLRARSVLKRRYGTVYVSFAEPISLAAALGPLRAKLQAASGRPEALPEIEEERRRFIQRLGFRLLREVNAAAVAGATSVSATALLGAPRAACRIDAFLEATQALVALLRAQGVRLTASLEGNAQRGFEDSLTWLQEGGLVQRLTDGGGTVLHVPNEKRFNLDFYKNNTIHFFLLPSLLTRALLADVPRSALGAHIGWWLDLYRWEFPLPERDALAAALDRWVAYYSDCGAILGDTAAPEHPVIRATAGILENFREAYLIAARTVAGHTDYPVTEADLTKRMREQFATALLLGEVHKPEGSSMITFGNALSRLTELGYVTIARSGRGGRSIDRGPVFDRLPDLIRHIST
jgi:glycerol-3-phosphate O-acyltransferase